MSINDNYEDDTVTGGGLRYFWQKIKGVFATKKEVEETQATLDHLTNSLDTFLNGDDSDEYRE